MTDLPGYIQRQVTDGNADSVPYLAETIAERREQPVDEVREELRRASQEFDIDEVLISP